MGTYAQRSVAAAPTVRLIAKPGPVVAQVKGLLRRPHNLIQMRMQPKGPRVVRRKFTSRRTYRRTTRRVLSPLTMMDPFQNPGPPPSATSIGEFTTINSVLRQSLSSGNGLNSKYVVLFHSTSSVRGFIFDCTDGPGFSTGPLSYIQLPQLSQSTPTPQSNIRPLRVALKIRNDSVFTGVSGELQVLKMPQQFSLGAPNNNNGADQAILSGAGNLTFTAAFMDGMKAALAGSLRTHTLTAADLLHTHKVILAPASHIGYNEWLDYLPPFNGSESGPALGSWTTAQAITTVNSLIYGLDVDAMETLILRFPPSANINTYTMTVVWQDAVRYPIGSTLGSMGDQQPTGDAATIRRSHLAAQATTIFEEVGEVVGAGLAAAAVVSRAFPFV